jgi:hypothetical protein
MESQPAAKYQKLITMMTAFMAGDSRSRSRDFVAQMEAEFIATGLDADERFSDLELALAMFGASDREADEKMLVGECRYVLRVLGPEA